MAIIQISKIQHRTGANVDLPQLAEGELGFATDERRLYIGNDPNLYPPSGSSLTTQTEILTEVSVLNWSKIGGTANTQIALTSPVGNGQVLVANANTWVNAGGTSNIKIDLGNANNVVLRGGLNGYVLTTDGAGNLTWEGTGVGTFRIQDISKANPAVVTTINDNTVVTGIPLTIIGVNGMTQIATAGENGTNKYYGVKLTNKTFSLYSDPALANAVNSTGFTPAVSNTGNIICSFYQAGTGVPGGANTQIQFQDTAGLFGGSANLTFNKDTNNLALNGNANITRIATTLLTSANVIGSIGLGVGNANPGNFTAITANSTISAAGTITGGNLRTTGQISAGGVITTAGLNTLGNANIGNLSLTGVVKGNLIPQDDLEQNLGSPTQRWKELYLSGNTIYLGNTSITANADGISSNVLTAENANLGNLVNANFISATFTADSSSQPNISSVGTLTGLTVAGITDLGDVANVRITGGYPDYVLQTDGLGNLAWNPVALPDIVAGSTNQIQYNVNDGLAASANLTFNPATSTLQSVTISATGNLNSTNLNVSNNIISNSNIRGANISSTGTILANGNIQGANINANTQISTAGNVFANVLNSNSVSVLGNVRAGNINSVNVVSANGNVSGANLITAGQMSANGNVTGANLLTSGNVNAVGAVNSQQINSGNISVSGNIISSNLVINNEISSTGNITSDNYILGNGAFLTGINLGNQSGLNQIVNGSSNVSIPSVNGDIRIGSGGTPNVVRVTNTGLTVTGNITSSGSANFGSIASGIISANGNISGNSVTANGNLQVSGNANTGPLSVTGTISASGNATVNNLITGQVNATGNLVSSNANLGNLATANFFQGDGSLLTNLTIAAGSAIVNGNSNVSVAANGNVRVSVGGTSNVQVITSTGIAVTGTHSASGTVTGANLNTTGNVSATGNVIGGNLSTTGNINASGNIAGLTVNAVGNINAVGSISTSANITATGNLVANNASLGNANVTGVISVVGVVASGNVIAANLNATGNLSVVSNVNANNISITGNIVSAGNLSINNINANTLTAAGNISAGNAQLGNAVTANTFLGNIRGNLFNGTTVINIPSANANVAISVNNTSNVVVISQNTLAVTGNLSVTGTSNLANVNANVANLATVNSTVVNAAVLSSTGLVQGIDISATGNITVDGEAVLGSTTVLGYAVVTGDIYGGNLLTEGQISTSANVYSDILIANTLNTTANADVGNLVTTGNVIATGLVRGGNLSAIANVFANGVNVGNANINSNLFVTNLANVGNAIVRGNLSAYSNVKSDNVYSNTLLINSSAILNSLEVSTFVTSNLIPNVDNAYYLGTPSNRWRSLDVSNVGIAIGQTSLTSNVNQLTINAGNTIIPSAIITDLTLANYANLGDIGNLRIFGGSDNDVLTTDGNGIISFTNILTVIPAAGNNTEIQFNDNGNFNASSSLRFFKSNGVTSGTFAGNASRLFGIAGSNVTGQVPNALVATTVSLPSQANITAVGNLSSLSVVGNVRAGNANLGNLVTANFMSGILTSSNQPNISNVGELVGLTVSNVAGVVNFEYTANVTLGTISNLHIAGGINGQFLTTDGVGNLSWSSPIASGVANGLSNMTIQENGNIAFQIAGFANRFRIEQSTFSSNVQGLFNESVSFFAPVNLGTIANVRILGGQTGQVLTTTGVAGQIGWAAAPATQSIVNGNSNVVVGPNTNIRISVAGTPNVTQFTNTGIITSVVSATGIVNTGLASLGNISNVKIFGGSAGQIIQTDGTGNLSYVAAPVSATLANGQSNITIDLSGNVRTSVAGNANVFVVANTGITVTGRSNLGPIGNVTITGGAANQLLSTDGTGNLSWVASPPTFVISNGTSNLTVNQNGNIIANVTGTLNALQIGNNGITVGGFVSATGNIVTDITRLKVTGGIANQVLTVADAGGNLIFGSLPASNQLVGGNSNVTVTPNANVSIGVTGVPNVMVISPSRVNITGDLAITGNANLTSADALNIPGGNPGDVLSTDGAGNLSFVTPSVGTAIVNGSSNVRIPTSASNITFAVSGTPNVFVISPTLANLTGNLSVTGNSNINGNINLGSSLSAAGNVVGQNFNTPGTITASGSINTSQNLSVTGGATITGQLTIGSANLGNVLNGSGNISLTGNIAANNLIGGNLSTTGNINGNNVTAGANVISGNVYVSNTVSAAGNIATSTNITAAGTISAIGNITADRFIGNGALLTNVSANVSRIANGVSNITIPVANGNIGVTVGGASVVTISPGNFIIATDSGIGGNLNVFENITAGNRITANGNITAVGNITGNYIYGNGAFLTGVNTDIYNDANVANYLPNYTGNINNVNNIIASNIIRTSGLQVSYLSVSSATTLTTARAGALIDVTNSSYQIILPTPLGNPGVNYTFRLRQSGQFVTLVTPSGTFEGSGYTGSGTVVISYNIGQFFYIYSDGSKYVISARIESETGAGLRVRTGVQSTSTTTGALVVTGGIGVSGNLNSGGNAAFSGGLTIGGSFNAVAANITQTTGNIFGRSTSNIVITNGDTGSGEVAIRAGGSIIQTINNANITVNGNITATGNISASGNFTAPFANVTGNVTTPILIVNTISSNAANTANSTANIFANNITTSNINSNGSIILGGLLGLHANGNITNVQNLQVSNVNAQNITAPVFNTGNISVSGNVVANGVVHSNNVGTGNNFRVGNSVWLGDLNTADSLAIRSQQNPTVGYITFGSDSTAKLGRSGTAALTWNANLSVGGTITANNFVGNINVANTDLSANSFTSNNFFGGNFVGRHTITVVGANTVEMVRANIAGPTNSDYFSIEVGGTNQDFGFVSFNTGDNGAEPIYFRQYNGTSIQRQVTLLDASGNTTFPGNISTTGSVAASDLYGNLTVFVPAPQTANIINATMAGSDFFRLQVGGTLSDQGYVALDVGNEGSESIIFRQYSGVNFASEVRRVTLLDSFGNAIFPQTVSATGFLGSNLTVTGNIVGANISGNISTTGNLTAGNFVGNLVATNSNATNYTGGNVSVTGNVTAVGNVFANIHTGNTVSVTGTISGATLVGNVSACAIAVTSLTGTNASLTGNITANNFISTSNGTGNNFGIGNDAFIGDINVADTVIIKGQSNPANGFIVFGTSNNSQTLGRSGTGPLTYQGSFSANGTITANNFVGNFSIGNTDLSANSFTSNNFFGGNFIGSHITNTITGSNTFQLIRSNIADNDFFRVIVGGTGIDQGFVSFDTGDQGNEPIYFRQYNGATIQNEVTLLDSAGNTILSGNLNTTANVIANNFFGNLRVALTGAANADVISGTIATTDAFRLQVGGTGASQGFISLDTAGGGNEPIFVRQYTQGFAGPYTTLTRQLTLLDPNGNTILPGRLSVAGNTTLQSGLSVAGNIDAPQINTTGNISTGANISASGNISAGSFVNAGQISAIGTIKTSTLSATGTILGDSNMSLVGNITANRISALGNISTSGNIVTSANVSTSGNVFAASLVGNLSATAASITNMTGTNASVTGNITGSIVIATATGTGNNFRVGSRAWIGDINVNDTIIIQGQQNAANGYIIFGNANNSQTLGRAGTGALTYTGDFSASGNITANNFIGNINIGNADVSANSFTSNNFYGGNFFGLLTSNTLTGTNNANLILANIATSDYFKLTVGGTSTDAGFVAFDIGDNGDETILFRQYNGATPRTLTLMDAAGNTIFPGNISTNGNITANVVNASLQASVAGTNTANIVQATMATSDAFRIQVGGTSFDQGYVSIDTGNEGTEQIYVRQYVQTGGNPFGSILRQATLLGASGDTIFPGDLSAGGNLSVAGNILSSGNFSVSTLSASGNIRTSSNISATGNILTASNLTAVGGIVGQTLTSLGLISATGVIVANSGINSNQAITVVGNVVSSNVNTGNITATGNVFAPTHLGTTVSVSGNVTAANFTGNLTATSAVITNHTGSNSSVTGNVTGNIVISSSTGAGQNFRVGTTAWIGDVGVSEALLVSGQANAANGYIIFGNANNSARLGRAGTGPLTYTGDMSLAGNLTAGNILGNFSLTGDLTANSFTANYFFGGNLNGVLTCNNLTGTNNANLILANIATNDYFRLTVGGTAADSGFVSFDIGDNGNEPIYFRQYTGASTITREVTLLDSAGNTTLPGNLSVVGNINTANNVIANSFVGSLSVVLSGVQTANIINTTIADNDYFRIQVGGTGSNSGFVSLDTANDGSEPIYVRQYISTQPNPYNAINRQLTLLDATGQTILPGNLSVAGNTTLTNLSASGNITSTIVTPTQTGTSNINAISGTIATADYYRIQVGGTSADAGFLSIDTADNGNEPIYVRQYSTTGSTPWDSVTRQLTLLDSAGNTSLPGNLTVNGGNSTQLVQSLGSQYRIGYRGYPVLALSTSYTITVNDPSLTLLFTGQSGGTLLNIPTNATAAVAIGAQIRIINNDAAQGLTVSPAIGVTLRYQGSTGSRTLSTYADVTLIKVAPDTWFINGYGIT